jgi:hypothetical protein
MKTSSKNSLCPHRTTLNCEQLESRTNPGNVRAFVSQGSLWVYGDNSGVTFTVQENLAGDYFVIAGAGTTINGTSAVGFGAIHPINVTADAGKGDNHIAIYGVHPSNILWMTLGSGNDYVNLSGDHANYVSVNEGGGNNTLVTTQVYATASATFLAGNGYNVWYDNGYEAGQVVERGWSEIIY